jgi:hypothetical protein
MRDASWGRMLACGLSCAVLALLSACGGDPAGTTGAWKYDEQASVDRTGDSKKAGDILKRALSGMTATLEFHRDNTYRLTIAGGPDPREETGSFKSGNGMMVLSPKIRNGQAVAASSDYNLKAPDSKHLELNLKGHTAVLIPAAPPPK